MAIINPTVYGSGGITATLVISVEEGAVITAVNGPTVLRAEMGDKPAKIKLTQAGDWTVTATLNGKTTKPQIVTVPEEYPVELFFEPVVRKCEETLNVPEPRGDAAAASVGGHALFAGGTNNNVRTALVEAFDGTLTRSTPTPLSEGRSDVAAASTANHAIFGGGSPASGFSIVVDAYDESLTRSTPEALSVARGAVAAAAVGEYVLFAGGYISTSQNSNVVDAYSQSLTRTTPTTLYYASDALGAASVRGYAIFAGSTGVEAYTATLTRVTATSLSGSPRKALVGGAVGEHALFAGGYYTTTNYPSAAAVDAYDQFLVHSNPEALSKARSGHAAVSVNPYVLFGGGVRSYGSVTEGGLKSEILTDMDVYDESLTRTSPEPLSVARDRLTAAAVANYALFNGGYNYGLIDVYVVE